MTSLSKIETYVSKVFREAFPYTKPKRRTNLQQGADLVIVSKVFCEAFPYTKPKRRTNLQQGADLSGEECSAQSSLVGR